MTDLTPESVKALLDAATPGPVVSATAVEVAKIRQRVQLGQHFPDGGEARSNAGLLAAAPDLASALLQAWEERDALQALLRTVCGILVEAVGAGGPCDAEDAARRVVEALEAARDDAHREAALARGFQARADAAGERARIVAWLRDEAGNSDPESSMWNAYRAAAAIERGEHSPDRGEEE